MMSWLCAGQFSLEQHASPVSTLVCCNHTAAEAGLTRHISLAVWQSAFVLVPMRANAAAKATAAVEN